MSAPRPEVAGLIVSALARLGGEGDQTELLAATSDSGVIGAEGLISTLQWLEQALLIEQIGPDLWRLTPDLSSGLPTRIVDQDPMSTEFNLNEIAGWGAATLGTSDAVEALISASTDQHALPRTVTRALSRLAQIRGTSRAGTYRLDRAFDALENRMPLEFEIYRRRKLTEGKPASLQELGEERGVSRERIRQLETRFDKHLEGTVANPDNPIYTAALRLADHIGPVIRTDSLDFAIDALGPGAAAVRAPRERLTLLLRLGGPYHREGRWLVRNHFRHACTEHLDQMVDTNEFPLVSEVATQLIGLGLREGDVTEWLSDLAGYRIYAERLVRLGSTLADRGVALLALHGAPMTLDELFAELNEERSLRSFKNQIQQDRRVRRLGIKYYGLAAWGGEQYTTVLEEMRRQIERSGGSLPQEQLANELSARFGVSAASVAMYSTGPQFIVDGSGCVSLADGRRAPQLKPLELTRCCFRLPTGWSYRRTVDPGVLRGSGGPIPPAFAQQLGLKPGDSVQLDTPFGLVNCSWPGHVATIGSLRKIALRFGASEDDYLFILATGPLEADFRHVSVASCRSATGLERLAVECGLTTATVVGVGGALGVPDGAAATLRARIRQRLVQRGEENLLDLVPSDSERDVLEALANL